MKPTKQQVDSMIEDANFTTDALLDSTDFNDLWSMDETSEALEAIGNIILFIGGLEVADEEQ